MASEHCPPSHYLPKSYHVCAVAVCRSAALEQLAALESAKRTLDASLSDAQALAAQQAARLAALEEEKASAVALAAEQQGAAAQHEQELAAALAAEQAELRATVATLEQQLSEARGRIGEATARSEAAEAAKIELSLKVAELAAAADAGPDVHALPFPEFTRMAGGEGDSDESDLDLLRRRAHAAEVAASAASRRAATAEVEVDTLKVALADADKKVNDLAWQVKMMVGGSSSAQGSSGTQEVQAAESTQGAMVNLKKLDLFGCGINYSRK